MIVKTCWCGVAIGTRERGAKGEKVIVSVGSSAMVRPAYLDWTSTRARHQYKDGAPRTSDAFWCVSSKNIRIIETYRRRRMRLNGNVSRGTNKNACCKTRWRGFHQTRLPTPPSFFFIQLDCLLIDSQSNHTYIIRVV